MPTDPGRQKLATDIADARASLTSTLSSLEREDWEAPSLCAGWAVRDVVGHLLHQYSLYRAPYPRPAFARAGFRVNRFLATEARRFAGGRSPEGLLGALAAAEYERTTTWKLYPWRAFALSEFVIHAQDIRRALGIDDKPDPLHLATIASLFARPARANPFRPVLPPRRYEATDADWTYGEGPLVRGPLEAIVMVLAGRPQALGDLSGEGVGGLQAALS